MELNREQIMKALEHWIKNFDGKATDFMLLGQTIELIKELTVEVEAMRGAANSYKMHYENVKADTIRNIKTHVHNKAVYPDGTREHGYITLKAFDNVIDEMLRR